ncbi:UDP-N-acetylglucosamine 1-carboxyvinyltransferase [Geobacter sp. SVR]|uniref:UDP-N-acetylglucosamine 1-carboxyvinyltransferase n=1 Tax=Geobacter sp. SVR TaxID=2495594 RepID=UPI00143EF9A4|nr:UDP-N-acetylglucosamine 1-carboxyvinyltransferase [Geobacter sp. SVR]BCS52396.1 UDP-N-acetylglucosamine 1-carboxyvinyltransferase [Geobacter sp. SVR]GCF87371.1 UDP-N-acetylglucosamine 1-carboxyvinyltransferase [Geobacter sp. SVR]
MDKLIIKGGNKLKGDVQVSGSKNAALPIFVSTILAPGKNEIRNVPFLRDINTTIKVLESLGAQVVGNGHIVTIDTAGINSCEATYELVKTMRASVLVLGPLLARFGKARVSLPGGCAIGARPINLHLKGLQALGAEINLEHGYVEAKAKRLKGARINFDISTVGGTEHLMMAAATAKGETILENAAREPEIVDLAQILNQMGARIEGAGTDTVRIQGVTELFPTTYSVMPDRIEAGTFMIAAAITGGDIRISGMKPEHLDALVFKLQDAGVEITSRDNVVRVKAPKKLKSVNIKTRPYPGFPTDMQAQFMALMCLAEGASVISENIFENRYMHVSELLRFGADIVIEGNSATVKGVKKLSGAPVMATDLRASASLILAGLAAAETTEISRIYHLDRGYESIEKKLAALGADIVRVKE